MANRCYDALGRRIVGVPYRLIMAKRLTTPRDPFSRASRKT